MVLAFYQERVLSKQVGAERQQQLWATAGGFSTANHAIMLLAMPLQAEVDPYFPFLHVEVAADVLLFQPRPGMQLGEHPTTDTPKADKPAASRQHPPTAWEQW